MEVILNKDVERIGRSGQVVKVKDGFARNFLFPNKLAVPLNTANLKHLEEEKLRRSHEQERLKREAQALKEKLAGVSLTMPVLVQEDEKIYGSISSGDIIAALKEDNIDIDKNLIILDEPIKQLGIYEVPIKLHPEVDAQIKIWVVKK
ncbi:MAG: 50S ribosomal protein L9 [Candidatus Omnitrophica bacterium]|nr:50S ribosomal protein L9 [Candidatus Omnitrophota bacterium]